jgi:hypothetical protein
MNSRVDPSALRRQITLLLHQYPELADDEQLRVDTIEGETNLDDALRLFLGKIFDAESYAEGTDDIIKRFQERKARLERRAEAYRALIFDLMQSAGLRKQELPEATLSIRNVAPKVIITDESALPLVACKIISKPDITKIKELLMDGGQCTGAVLGNGSEALTIRIK